MTRIELEEPHTLCITCLHHRGGGCLRPVRISPVNGKPIRRMAWCDQERSRTIDENGTECCGPDATFWEPAPPAPPPPSPPPHRTRRDTIIGAVFLLSLLIAPPLIFIGLNTLMK